MRQGVFALAAVVLLAACDGGGGGGAELSRIAPAPTVEFAEVAAPAEAAAPDAVMADEAPSRAPGPAASTALLAYEHRVALEMPAARVEPAMRAHERACLAAGAQLCQLINTSSSAYGEDSVSAVLAFRATPDWLAAFRARLEADVEAAQGRIRETGVSTEDLTRNIIDTEARLKAQETLRNRLQELLRARPGKLGELLELERELARVQGELDAARSSLAVMRARVAMSLMTVSYETRPSAVSRGALAPIGDAFNGALGVMAVVIAGLISLFAALIPLALVLGPIGYGIWRFARRSRRAS